jgi:hypothetical protein
VWYASSQNKLNETNLIIEWSEKKTRRRERERERERERKGEN